MATCPACAAELSQAPALRGSDRLHGVPGTFHVHACTRCGSARTLPLVSESALAAFYPDAYNAFRLPTYAPARAAAVALYRWRYWRALRTDPLRALRALAPGRLLDVGSGRGDLGVVLRARGWDVTGVEPSDAACAEAVARGVRTEHGTLAATAPRLRGPYDAVVFQHSLEHVTEPADELRLAHRLLRPGGLLVVSLPNFGSWQRRRFGADWFHLDLPRHRSHFTPRGLAVLLDRTGYELRRLTTGTSSDGLPMSLQYRVFGRRRFTRGAPLYLSFAASLALVPVTTAANVAGGGGDILHAVAARS